MTLQAKLISFDYLQFPELLEIKNFLMTKPWAKILRTLTKVEYFKGSLLKFQAITFQIHQAFLSLPDR